MTEESKFGFKRFAEFESQRREERLDYCMAFVEWICIMLLISCTINAGVIWSILSGLRQRPLYEPGTLANIALSDYITLFSAIALLTPTAKRGPKQWEDWYRRKPQIIALLVFITGNIMQWFDDGHGLGVDATPMLRDVYSGTVIAARVIILTVGYLIIYLCYRQKTCPERSPLGNRSGLVLALIVVFIFPVLPFLFRFIIGPHLPKVLYF